VDDDPDLEDGLSGPSHFRRKPPNPGYRVAGVPKRYVEQVQLSAVLRPAYGKLRTEADIADATGWILHHWRKKSGKLAQAGCPPFHNDDPAKSRLNNALGCRVAFVLTYSRPGGAGVRPCGMATICPFCWARAVRLQWQAIDAAFFPAKPASPKQRRRLVDVDHGEPEKSLPFTRSVKGGETAVKSPYDLIRRVFTFRVPAIHKAAQLTGLRHKDDYATVTMSGILAWLQSRIQGWPFPSLHRLPECRGLVEAAGPVGGLLEMVHFRRVAPDTEAAPWEVQVRQLILAQDGAKVPTALHPASFEPKFHTVVHNPRRRYVVSAVAKTLHYPNWLIDPATPVDDVVEYLEVRGSRRLIANYGSFRRSFRNRKT
jgi:hypothetical protein